MRSPPPQRACVEPVGAPVQGVSETEPAARDRHGGPLSRASCYQFGIRLSCLSAAFRPKLEGCTMRSQSLTLGLAVCCVVCMWQHGGVSVRCLAACKDAGWRSWYTWVQGHLQLSQGDPGGQASPGQRPVSRFRSKPLRPRPCVDCDRSLRRLTREESL